MKGKVLGYSSQTGEGAITAEGGDRYRFKKSDWSSEDEPVIGADVDFVPNDGHAEEIYPLRKTNSIPAMTNFSVGDGGKAAQGLEWTLARPAFIGSVLAIIGWLAIGGLVILGQVGDASSAIGNMNRMARQFGAGAESTLFIHLGLYILILYYAIPLLAGFHIYQTVIGQGAPLIRLLLGAAAVALPIALPILSGTLIMAGLPEGMRDLTRALGGDTFNANSLGLGSFIIIAGGALVLLKHFGVVESFKSSA